MDEYVKEIIKKINSNDLVFDWGETQVLYNNVKVAKAFVEKINTDYTLWNSQFDEFMNSFVFYEIKPLPEHFLDNVAKWHVENNVLNSCFFGLLSSDEYVSSDFWQFLDLKLSDDKFNFDIPDKTVMNEKLLNILLNHKRYNSIAKIEIFKNIEENLLQRLLEEYPFDKYPIPIFFEKYFNTNFSHLSLEDKVYYVYNNRDKMSFACLLYLIDNGIIPNGYIALSIIEKLKNNTRIELPNNFDIEKLERIIPNNYKLKLYYNSLKNNCIDIVLRSKEDFSQNSIIISYTCNLILSGVKVSEVTNISLLNNRDFVEALIYKGHIKQASKSKLFDNYIDYIINLINSKNENYTNYSLTFDYGKYSSITEAFINNGELLSNSGAINSIKHFDKIKEIITSDPEFCSNLETLPQEICNDSEIISILLEKKYYANFFFIFIRNKNINMEFKNNINLFEQLIKSDVAFATLLLQNFSSEVVMDAKLMSIYINLGDPFMNTIINYLETHFEYFDAYSDELFNEIKISIAKKYSLNLSHLTKLEQLYGPGIIAFIELPNIHKIVNLTDREFNLFCSLFPVENPIKISNVKSEIYDAFKQLEFTTEEKDSILIFSNIKKSIQDKNLDYITLLNELKSFFNESRFSVIQKTYSKKYPILLNGINDTFEFIKHNLEDKKDKKNTLELIHELCNVYIKFKREEYRVSENYNFERDLNLKTEPDDRTFSNDFIKRMLNDGYTFIDNEKIPFLKLLIAENSGEDESLIEDCAKYYIDKNSILKNDVNIVKRNIKKLLQLFNSCMEKYSDKLNVREITRVTTQNCNVRHGYFLSNEREYKYICKLLDINLNKLGNRCIFFEVLNNNDLLAFINQLLKKNKTYTLPKLEQFKEKYNLKSNEEIASYLEEKIKYFRLYNLFYIFNSLDVDIIRDNVLSSKVNDEIKKRKGIENDTDYLYESLKNTIKKYHLHLLPEELNNLLHNECFNISCGVKDIASFITYYYKIYDLKLESAIHKNIKEERERIERELLDSDEEIDKIEIDEKAITKKTIESFTLPIVEVFQQADVFSSSSSVYSLILGPKDAMYIKTNPAPLPAKHKIKNDGRLKEAVQWTLKNFKRQEVTIPTFNEILEQKGKKMRVIVGNFTAPYNLTHAERTESCMRIGGEGETFFDFCLSNVNGFHITFESPEGEYVSRVSGFRNGNTVFLNELRESCVRDKYSNEDIVDFTREMSRLLIEYSKNSSCPIENVVVSRRYATLEVPDEDVKLNVTDIKEGLGAFYSDVDQNCIVLATTNTDSNKKFVDVNLDNSKVPRYNVGRESIKLGNNDEIIAQINRIHSIKQMIDYGVSFDNVTGILNNVKTAIVGGDWYIYIDELNNIHEEIIDIHPEAKKEMNKARVILFSNLTSQEEVKLCI